VALPVLLAAKLGELGESELPGHGGDVRAAIGSSPAPDPPVPRTAGKRIPGEPIHAGRAIAGPGAASPWLDRAQRSYALGLADDWNERLESWCYVEDTPARP